MELRAGYKNTEIGVIPNGWEVKKLGEVVEIRKGQLITDSTRVNGNIPVIAGGKTPAYYHNKANRNGKTITVSGSGASAGYVSFHDYPIFASDCSTIEESKDYSIEFMFYLLQLLQEKIYKMQTGGAQPHIHPSDLNPILIPFPKPEEQTAIATALSDADALIRSLEKLIEKKRNIKQGAMQQLLKPKKGWDKKRVKEIVQTPVTDGPHETPIFYDMGIPFLSVNNLVDKKIDFTDLRFITMEDHLIYSKKCKPQRNDILLGKAASVGKVAIVETDLEFNIWSPIAMIRVKSDYSSKYVYYYLQTKDIVKQIEFFTNSSSQGNIGMGDIEKLEIPFPKTLNEQNEIATILSDMDNEISLLEKKVSKTKSLKQGMMQELLTGKIRLI